eukprot:364230-Chlamydomonas_euryale.AAC.2
MKRASPQGSGITTGEWADGWVHGRSGFLNHTEAGAQAHFTHSPCGRGRIAAAFWTTQGTVGATHRVDSQG